MGVKIALALGCLIATTVSCGGRADDPVAAAEDEKPDSEIGRAAAPDSLGVSASDPAVLRPTVFRTHVALSSRDVTFNDDGSEVSFAADLFNRAIGEPRLPLVKLTFLLPSDADLSGLHVYVSDGAEVEIPGTHDVGPALPPVFDDRVEWPSDKAFVDGRSVEVYGRDADYPAASLGEVKIGRLRDHNLVDVTVFPYRYNPVAKRLKKLTAGELWVECPRSGEQKVSARQGPASPVFDRFVASLVVNQDAAASLLKAGAGAPEARGPTGGASYVIATTEAIRSASTQLSAFVAEKQREGFTVLVATEAEWGGGTGDAAADNLREWLKDNYLTMGFEYLLIIGNPDPANGDVPMKMCWPRNNDTYDLDFRDAPTDFYFAELTGDWDADGDGKYGEQDDDQTRPGGPDGYAELMVGRIPFYGNVADLDAILAKSIAYAQDPNPEAWRKKALLPMVPSDRSTFGYQLGEAIKDDILIPSGWSYHRIYDDTNPYDENRPIEGVPTAETMPCNPTNVMNAWSASPYGLVVWWTHGWSNGAADVIDTSLVRELPDETDQHPAFTFQASCFNSQPEITDNLGYSLLKRGAMATVAASRVSWYYVGESMFAATDSNAGMAYQYSSGLVRQHLAAGAALGFGKSSTYNSSGGVWMNYLVFNLYGDPSLKILAGSASDPELTCNSRYRVDNARVGSVTPLDIACYNTGGGELTITSASSDRPWLSPSVTSPRSVRVMIDATGFNANEIYEGNITLESNGGERIVPIFIIARSRYYTRYGSGAQFYLSGLAFNQWSPNSPDHQFTLVNDYTWELRVNTPTALTNTPYKITAGFWANNWGGGTGPDTTLTMFGADATVSLDAGTSILRMIEQHDLSMQVHWAPVQELVWAGNVSQYPQDGSVTENDDFWVNVESSRVGAVAQSGAKVFVMTDSAPEWQAHVLELAGQRGSNDWWHLNLGSFPAGTVVHYKLELTGTNGSVITLDNGGANYSTTVTQQSAWRRTIVLIYGETQVGQDMFVRGGIDHSYAAAHLGLACTSTNYACAIPIRHRNLLNATTAPWKANDSYLDWYGVQAGQGTGADGTPLDWTTNRWPPEWGTKRTVEADGYGETPLNRWGPHYWLLDVDMDCTNTVDGWFELKSYIARGAGWEQNVTQPGAPYSSGNHFARCGSLNVFRRGENAPVEISSL